MKKNSFFVRNKGHFLSQKNSLLSTVTVFVISSYLLALLLLMNVVNVIRIRVIKESVVSAIRLLELLKNPSLVPLDYYILFLKNKI